MSSSNIFQPSICRRVCKTDVWRFEIVRIASADDDDDDDDDDGDDDDDDDDDDGDDDDDDDDDDDGGGGGGGGDNESVDGEETMNIFNTDTWSLPIHLRFGHKNSPTKVSAKMLFTGTKAWNKSSLPSEEKTVPVI